MHPCEVPQKNFRFDVYLNGNKKDRQAKYILEIEWKFLIVIYFILGWKCTGHWTLPGSWMFHLPGDVASVGLLFRLFFYLFSFCIKMWHYVYIANFWFTYRMSNYVLDRRYMQKKRSKTIQKRTKNDLNQPCCYDRFGSLLDRFWIVFESFWITFFHFF